MYGISVVIDDIACIIREWKQYKFPKSKKRRIRKKWEKRSANFRTTNVHRVLNTNDKLFVSSLVFEKLKGSAKWSLKDTQKGFSYGIF